MSSAVHYPVPLHLQPVFAGLNLPEGSFPISEFATRRVLSLPVANGSDGIGTRQIASGVMKR